MRIPFRVAILTLVLVLVGVTSGVLIVFMLGKEGESVNYLKGIYLEQLAKATAHETGHLPRLAGEILEECQRLNSAGLLPLEQPEMLGRFFAERLRAHSSLKWVSYGSTNGNFVGATRAGTNIVLNFSRLEENGGMPREFVLDAQNRLSPFVRATQLTTRYDPRTREWFRQAMAAPGRIVWLPPYNFSEGVLGITGALTDAPSREQPAQGVFTADFSLEAIQEYLGEVKVAEHGFAALFDEQGKLLAAPVSELSSERLQGVLRYVERSKNQMLHTNSTEIVKLNQQNHELLSREVAPGTGLNWIALILVPSQDFLGFVERNRQVTLLVLVTAVALSLLLGAFLSNSISRPLATVVNELARVSRFEFEERPAQHSNLKEIELVQSTLKAMKASLRSFSRYAPEDIVRQILVSGEDASLSGQRREVTLLFCDLRGFTHLSEGISPEQVVALLNAHFDALVNIVVKYNGYVCDFLGDALFVVFGAPAESKTHARDATLCALEMQITRHRLDEENRAHGLPEMEMGIGINTGTCVVGNMGSLRRIKYGIVGPSVNLASRIESFTVGGQILVSDSTRELLGGKLVAGGPFHMEGKGIGSVLTLWDAQGLSDLPQLKLPTATDQLVPLAKPWVAEVRRYSGKSLESEPQSASISKLSERAARLGCVAGLKPFSSLQIKFRLPQGQELTLDAKVRATEEKDYLISFTGIQPDTRKRLAEAIRV